MSSARLIAIVFAAALVCGCSLLAPSDAELMGGAAKDAAGDADSDAGDASDEGGGFDSGCLPTGAFCNGVPARCCSATCNGAAGKKCD